MRQILKVLVGSQAHGLALDSSDRDYRGVFIHPTEDFFRVGGSKPKETTWVEGATEDDTAYELGHFLHLATRCNPTILEVFVAPIVEADELGEELRGLFPHIWSAKGVLDAFTGYSLNQRKKFLDDKYPNRDRKWKFAAHYLRTLVMGIYLFRTGELSCKVPEYYRLELKRIREGKLSEGQIIDEAGRFETVLLTEYENIRGKTADLELINEFVMKVRMENWEETEDQHKAAEGC